MYGTQEGRDGYDSIEWIAKQKWCNEKVAMAGNSWLATTQWYIAAEQPPHLTCMAPWEGLGDFYRESICRGGIPDHAFWDVLMEWACGSLYLILWTIMGLSFLELTSCPIRAERSGGRWQDDRAASALHRLLGG